MIPSSKAFRAARRKARNVSCTSRECELTRRLIAYLAFAPAEINCGVLPELSYHSHLSTVLFTVNDYSDECLFISLTAENRSVISASDPTKKEAGRLVHEHKVDPRPSTLRRKD